MPHPSKLYTYVKEAVFDFANGICDESMGGFFHLKKERMLYFMSLGSIFLDKNSRCWTRKGFFSFLDEKNRPLIRHKFRLQNHLQIK